MYTNFSILWSHLKCTKTPANDKSNTYRGEDLTRKLQKKTQSVGTVYKHTRNGILSDCIADVSLQLLTVEH